MEVPYGVDSDDLAVFAGSPRTHFQQDDEAWENLVKYHLTCCGLVERSIGEWYLMMNVAKMVVVECPLVENSDESRYLS